MNKLQAFWMTHKKQLLIGGGVGAAGLGLYAATRPPADPTTTDPSSSAGADGALIGGYAAGPGDAWGANGAYDSTGNDVYDALQPQIEQTQSMLQELLDRIAKPKKRHHQGNGGGKKKPPRRGSRHPGKPDPGTKPKPRLRIAAAAPRRAPVTPNRAKYRPPAPTRRR